MDLLQATQNYFEVLKLREEQVKILGGDFIDNEIEFARMELGTAFADSLGFPRPRPSLDIYTEEQERIASLRRAPSQTLRQQIFDRDGRKCVECGSTDNLSADHVIPFSRGGLTVADNLATLCRPCNSRKGNRL